MSRFKLVEKIDHKGLQDLCLFKVFVALKYSCTFEGVNYGYKKNSLIESPKKIIYQYSHSDLPQERKQWAGKEIPFDKVENMKGIKAILAFLERLETEHPNVVGYIEVYNNTFVVDETNKKIKKCIAKWS